MLGDVDAGRGAARRRRAAVQVRRRPSRPAAPASRPRVREAAERAAAGARGCRAARSASATGAPTTSSGAATKTISQVLGHVPGSERCAAPSAPISAAASAASPARKATAAGRRPAPGRGALPRGTARRRRRARRRAIGVAHPRRSRASAERRPTIASSTADQRRPSTADRGAADDHREPRPRGTTTPALASGDPAHARGPTQQRQGGGGDERCRRRPTDGRVLHRAVAKARAAAPARRQRSIARPDADHRRGRARPVIAAASPRRSSSGA